MDLFEKINILNKSDNDKFKIKKDIIEYISDCQSHMNTGNKSIFYFDDDHPSFKGADMINDLIMKEIEKIELNKN